MRLFFEEQPERVYFPNHASYWEYQEHVEAEHEQHLRDGSFRVVEADEVRVGNPLQVEATITPTKKKLRTCLDARFPNAHLASYAFTQETLGRHAAQIIDRDAHMITSDIEKAYFQVPLHKESQGYMAWRHAGKWIVPTICPFGAKPIPFVFTKIMRPVLTYARALRMRGSNCIDDNLWADSAERMPEVVQVVQMLFGRLGWAFNSKCVWTPSTAVIYNGMWLDSARFEIRATEEKIEAARKLAWLLWFAARDGNMVRVKDLQRLTGRLQSMKLALEGVAVWTRGLYADIARALGSIPEGDFPPQDFATHLREKALEDLNFWAYRLGKQNGLPIRDPTQEAHVTIYCDASDVGWGAHAEHGGQRVGEGEGRLPREVLGESSTARELRGLLLATSEMADTLRGRNVRVRMDSLPAIRNLINGGGPVEQLSDMVREWWIWCKAHKVTPLYEWIPREQNTGADELSKRQAEGFDMQPGVERTVREWLVSLGEPGITSNHWLQTAVQTPKLDHVQVRIEEMIRARRPACILVPAWRGATWWPMLKQFSAEVRPMGPAKDVYKLFAPQDTTIQDADIQAHILVPELRPLSKKQERDAKKAKEAAARKRAKGAAAATAEQA